MFRNALWVSASAYALALTYFSDHFGPFACVALIPFFVVIRKSSKLASTGQGMLWGAVYFTLFGLLKPCLSPTSFSAFVFIGVVSSGLLALCLNIASRRLGFNPVALGLVWLIFEIIRIELVIHSGTIASGQPVDAPLFDISALTGVSGLSFLIVLVNVWLIRLWQWVRRRWSRPTWQGSAENRLKIDTARFAIAGTLSLLCPEERGPPIGPIGIIRVAGLFLRVVYVRQPVQKAALSLVAYTTRATSPSQEHYIKNPKEKNHEVVHKRVYDSRCSFLCSTTICRGNSSSHPRADTHPGDRAEC